jgi:flagellar hook-basal body complex protein FliE
MTPLGSVQPIQAAALQRTDVPLPKISLPDGAPLPAVPTDGFGQLLDGLVSTVSSKQATSAQLTREVLLGESDQLHQSVIAMQEAGVAFSLMVEVRNKLVESYQELMRMQV